MNSKYQTVKYKQNQTSTIDELVSIEEPLEMIIYYKKNNDWINNSISITMRTPKNDEDLIVGLLFSEGIIQKTSEIKKVELLGHKTGKFKLQNKIRVTLNNSKNDKRIITKRENLKIFTSSIFFPIQINKKPRVDKIKNRGWTK